VGDIVFFGVQCGFLSQKLMPYAVHLVIVNNCWGHSSKKPKADGSVIAD